MKAEISASSSGESVLTASLISATLMRRIINLLRYCP
jgi:hypothetical protein